MLSLLLVLAGVALLFGGAEALVRGGAALALRLGLTPLVIGLTVVAFGTSMPELVVSVGAALDGRGAIAMGNVVGSNIANIALILGASALLSPLVAHAQVIRLDLPLLVVLSLLLAGIVADDEVLRWEGLVLLGLLVGYTIFSLWVARRATRDVQREFEAGLPAQSPSTGMALLLVVGGLALLVVGARLMVVGAVGVARAAGVAEVVIGLTVVAVGTSLPELATSLVAAARRQGDISIGNIVGSCIFNILGIVGTAALVRPMSGMGVSAVDLAVMVGLAILLLPLLRTGYRLGRLEGAGLFLGYGAYIAYVLLALR